MTSASTDWKVGARKSPESAFGGDQRRREFVKMILGVGNIAKQRLDLGELRGNVVPEHCNSPGRNGDLAGQRKKGGRFTRDVRAKQAEDFAGFDSQR